jgi:type VI secretion system protein ImpC
MSAENRVRVGIDVGLGERTEEARLVPETPFVLLVLGDFGGGGRSGATPVAFDRDDIDAAMARIGPVVRYAPPGAPPFELGFRSLEDFHPDRLYATVPLFASLRELRARLADDRTFAAAARELTGTDPASAEADPPSAGAAGAAGATGAAAALASGSLLDRVLSESGDTVTGEGDELATFLRRVVRPHLVASPDPRQAELLAGVDAALAAQLRALLHDAGFQALERSWRTLDFLARRIETGTTLRLYLLDVPRAALNAALDGEGGGVVLAQILDRTAASLPGGARWSAIAGLYEFGSREADVVRLAQLGAIARQLGAPFIGGAAPSFAGRETWAQLPDPREWGPPPPAMWDAVRAVPEASWVALAAPRFLLRAPYGEDGEPVDAFGFEEVGAPPSHDEFLWGSGAAAFALMLATSFAEDGWSMRPGAQAELRGLPLHVYQHAGETVAVPCAETLMSERAAERLVDIGISPLATIKETDTVRIVRLQSIAAPPVRLSGVWDRAR